MDIINYAKNARKASIILAALDNNVKNKALLAIADNLDSKKDKIIAANIKDIKKSEDNNVSSPLIKRLKFDEKKINQVINGIKCLTGMPDPVGKILNITELDNDLVLKKVSCPIGVTGVIFESRPDALVQISSLCLKSGNAVLLKGGSEAKNTNRVLADIIKDASLKAGLPEGWLGLLETREDVSKILKMDMYIDLIIPRGSNQFVKYIMENSNIPVLGHADGICHIYVDKTADIQKAASIAVDSKTQYAAVCNAVETLLVNNDIAKDFLPYLKQKMDEKNVVLKGCDRTCTIIPIQAADEEDFKTEYLDYILSIKIVDSIDDAILHINEYGSGHTDSIVSSDKDSIERFMNFVDSANVFSNCSTRFSDGFRYGLGAEVGISTNKIHARGPVGLEGLLIYKYKLTGNGNIVADYEDGKKSFTHKKLL